ncbi:16465_t:CDS:2, partial [Racocetra fulgida]
RPSVMESHLALHCKGDVPDKIRQHWLVQVAKRNDNIKDTDHSDDERYNPPERLTLAERMLDEEMARITVRTNNLLKKEQNLTL